MNMTHVCLDLMGFIEQNILPRYAMFDKAHNLVHVSNVIKKSLTLARTIGVDSDMSYTVAAYHDLGLEGPRAIHHITSGKILQSDMRLRQWFTEEQINTMKEAVEDHRASSSHVPRNIYGKIVAEADRELEPHTVFRRSIEYGLYHYPEKNRNEQWKRFLMHMQNKYSLHGYIKLWIPNSPNEKYLQELRTIINDESRLRTYFDNIYEQECCK